MFEWFIKRQLWQSWSHPSPLHPCSGICEKVKPPPPNGSSCSACFLKFMSWQHVRAWQGSMELCLASRESANMENHLVNLHVFVFGRRQYFFLFSLLFLSFLLVTVLVLFWYPFHTLFCTSSFLSLVTPSHFFCLTLTVWFSSFFHTFDTIHCMCPPPPLFPLPFSFPFSQTFSFSQHWNTGGSHPEELERPGAHPRLKTRPQPPLFHPFVSPEPQFTDCVALPQHSVPGDQIALQMSTIAKSSTKSQEKQKCQSMSSYLCT